VSSVLYCFSRGDADALAHLERQTPPIPSSSLLARFPQHFSQTAWAAHAVKQKHCSCKMGSRRCAVLAGWVGAIVCLIGVAQSLGFVVPFDAQITPANVQHATVNIINGTTFVIKEFRAGRLARDASWWAAKVQDPSFSTTTPI
jgi:hypothetical protein